MTKNELIGALHNILNNFVFGIVSSRFVAQETWEKLATECAVFQAPQGELLHVELEPLSRNMANPSDRKILVEEFEKSLKRAMMSEGHELILWYCEETKQYQNYKTEPWFQFARIIRNIVSHKQGGVLRQWPEDLKKKGISQVSWRNRIIDEKMVGKDIEFTHHEALQLFKDQLDFVVNKLA